MVLLYCFFSVCAAFVVKGVAGFGDPLIYNPLLSSIMNSNIITPAMAPVSVILNARVVWQKRKYFSWRIVFPICSFVLLGIIPGTYLLRYGAPMRLKLILGVVIIFTGIEMLTRKPIPGRKTNAFLRSILSFASGITAGLFGIDLLFLAYLERVSENREEFRSNVCFVFLLECIFRVSLYLWNGLFTKESLMLTAVALPGALLGLSIGGFFDKRISDRWSRKFIIYVFIVAGISTSIQAMLAIL